MAGGNGNGDSGSRLLLKVGSIELFEPVEKTSPPKTTCTLAKTMVEKVVEKVWNDYGKTIAVCADAEKVPIENALAVFSVESKKAYDDDLQLTIIRFEPAVFTKMSKKAVTVQRGKQIHEWDNFTKAVQVNEEAALMSTSYGLPQLMGFNYKVTKYPTPKELLINYQKSCVAQIQGFFDFVNRNKLMRFINQSDWPSFVERYNGSGQVEYYTEVLTSYISAINNLKKKGFIFKD